MKTSKINLIAIVSVTMALVSTSAAVAKNPNQGSSPSRPKPVNVNSTLGKKINSNTLSDAKLLGSSGFTITHGGNPPRTSGSGFVVTFGGNPPRGDSCKPKCDHDSCHHDSDCHDKCHHNDCYRGYDCVTMGSFRGFEPLHSTCVVLPGDTLATISLREYGTTTTSLDIAKFNNLPWNAVVAPGQMLMLPSISPSRVLMFSRAPAAVPFQAAYTN